MDKTSITNNTATNAFDLVLEDHAKMRELGSAILKANEENEIRDLFLMMMKVNTIHMFIEERVGSISHMILILQLLYPLIIKADRHDIVHATEEHNELKMILLEAQQFNLGSQKNEFMELMQTMIKKNEHHISEEEEKVLPVMRTVFDNATMEGLGKLWLEMKDIAPERPEKERDALEKMKESKLGGRLRTVV